jgi:hypothetical protein
VLHTATDTTPDGQPGAGGPDDRTEGAATARDTDPPLTGAQPHARIEASGRLLAAAAAIRQRGDRPGPVTLATAVTQARLATPPPSGTALNPAEAADLATALLARLANDARDA